MRHESLAGGFLSAEPLGKHCATLGTPFNVTVIVLLGPGAQGDRQGEPNRAGEAGDIVLNGT